jgi:tripartite-type tricarboxylate transporter receptor subunit TctC
MAVRRVSLVSWLVGSMALLGAAGTGHAQQAPLRLVVPFAAGGPADTVAREIGTRLGQRLGRPVLIENRGGAGGALGAVQVAKAAPDGSTLLATTSALVTSPFLMSNAGYDPVKDFVPIGTSSRAGFVVLASQKSGITTLRDLVAQARREKLSHGSSGTGTPIHLTSELLKRVLGIEMTHVPYKGSAPALADLMGGHIDIAVDSLVTGLNAAASGKIAALAVTTERRAPSAPSVPTVAESGFPGFEASAWYGLLAPAGTARALVAPLMEALAAVVKEPDLAARFENLGVEVFSVQGEAFGALIRDDARRWGGVIQQAGIKAE